MKPDFPACRSAVWNAVLRILLPAVLMQGAAALLSVLFVRRLDVLVRAVGEAAAPGEPLIGDLSRIFSALRTASVVPAILPPFPLCLAAAFLAAWGTGRLNPAREDRPRKRRIFSVLSVPAAAILFLTAFLLTLWLSDVNGVLFGGVISSLIRTVRSGALDALSAAPVLLQEVICL